MVRRNMFRYTELSLQRIILLVVNYLGVYYEKYFYFFFEEGRTLDIYIFFTLYIVH